MSEPIPCGRAHRTDGAYRALGFAALYDLLQRALGRHSGHRRFVRDFVRPSPGDRILDAGCGTGALLDYLPADIVYEGFDLDARYVAVARRRHGARGRFHSGGVDEVLFERGPFDLATAVALLHHLADGEAHALLATLGDQLRPGGSLVTVDLVRHRKGSALSHLLVALDRGRRVRTPEGYRKLVATHFAAVDGILVSDLNRWGYSHYVMRATKAVA